MDIVIITEKITLEQVTQLAKDSYGDMVKAVADIQQNILAIGGEFHADAEQKLVELGSEQNNLWGFNIYPDQPRDTWIEYYSLINVRPRMNNRSQIIQDESIQIKIRELVNKMVVSV